MSGNANCRFAAATAVLVALVWTAGCERERKLNRYSVLAGKVVACRTDTGELSVRASRRTADGPVEQTVYCLVTDDSEIYVNDRFSSIEEIQLGDAVELIGCRDPDPQLERFVVSFAYFDHPLPPPPAPEPAPNSAAAAADSVDQPAAQEE